jgi:hypothetical protein
LERSQVVDLLPTRSADSLGEWLAQHPEITTVSRDRQGVYAEGARRVTFFGGVFLMKLSALRTDTD